LKPGDPQSTNHPSNLLAGLHERSLESRCVDPSF
jgi:hypothetical protein